MSSDEFFKLCGFSSYTDIDYNAKAKVLLNLGRPIPSSLYAKADILFDGGVIEHIPNIFQAMCNIVLLIKKGGILVEGVPAACFGESYYNIDPLLFLDFYGANGFEMIEMFLYYKQDRLVNIKGMIRPFIPRPILEARRNRILTKHKAKAKIEPLGSVDIRQLGFLDPFNHKDVLKIRYFGLPPRTHICYVGIKRSDTNPEDIRVPTQENYPSVL